jgi:hypothetical protein
MLSFFEVSGSPYSAEPAGDSSCLGIWGPSLPLKVSVTEFADTWSSSVPVSRGSTVEFKCGRLSSILPRPFALGLQVGRRRKADKREQVRRRGECKMESLRSSAGGRGDVVDEVVRREEVRGEGEDVPTNWCFEYTAVGRSASVCTVAGEGRRACCCAMRLCCRSSVFTEHGSLTA